MTMSWFRMYAEFAHDPKVQMMSEAMQRRYIMMLCMRCGNGGVTLQDSEVTFMLRITSDEWRETKAVFIEKGFIDETNNLLNWDKRQYKSDSSRERVSAHRARIKAENQARNNGDENAVTLQKRRGNALDTDTDTDTDITPQPPTGGIAARFDVFWSAYPKKSGKDAARRAFAKRKANDALLAEMLAAIAEQAKSPQWVKDGGQYIPNPATWLNEGRWQDEPATNPTASGSDGDRPQWALDAGFPNRYEAENAMCWQHNAHQFRDGKRIGEVAA